MFVVVFYWIHISLNYGTHHEDTSLVFNLKLEINRLLSNTEKNDVAQTLTPTLYANNKMKKMKMFVCFSLSPFTYKEVQIFVPSFL